MSEGEFYKRLNESDAFWLFEKVLDEAKKEIYETMRLYGESSPAIEAIIKKWFGKQADLFQVTGGCTGHIDLEKLQDIEKE
jgi:hypothetical protein